MKIVERKLFFSETETLGLKIKDTQPQKNGAM